MTFFRVLLFGAIISVAGLVIGCGSSSSSGSDDITDNQGAMSSIPASDPTTIDYALVSSAAAISERGASQRESSARLAKSEGGFGGSTVTLRIKHVTGEGLGSFRINQCLNGTQMGHASYAFKNGTYTGDTYFRYGEYGTDIGITKKTGVAITDENFSGSIDLKFNSVARLMVNASGSTDVNTLRGTKSTTAIACAWNASLGCAKKEGGAAIPFAVSVNSSTKAKTYTTSTDQTLCSSVPEFATVAANKTLAGTDELWDCALPTGSSWVEVSKSTSAIEDAGGSVCKTATDAWESASTDPSACGAGAEASSIGCFCDRLYSMAVIESRRAFRMFECKLKGLFVLIKNGGITGVSLGDGETLYVKVTLSFGG